MEACDSTSDGKIASLPLMTRSFSLGLNDGEVQILPLTDALLDGTSVVGEDVVVIPNKGKK